MGRRTASVLVSAILLALVAAVPALADCYSYSSSVIWNWEPYNYACIGGGGTCRECGNYNNGGYGYFICYDTGPGAGAVYCVDYQGAMDFPF